MEPDNTKDYDISSLIEAMLAPETYPHPVEAIHLVQTHISCVFLTGEYAYKIKKPVYFGFLDYRTLEQRRAFCEQEVRLNRRLCPEIYLDVLPITRIGSDGTDGAEGGLRIGGEGEPVEWAARMRQMRETEMLPVRLRADTLGQGLIKRLAHKLARFHAGAHTDASIRAYGTPASIADTIRLTLRTMQEVTQETPLAEVYRTLHAYFQWFQQVYGIHLRERMERNHVRDCHGDLRAQNICLDARFGDGIQIFDCIEFNTAFRYIDTAADIAYLAMDLDFAGHADFRSRLMKIYTEEAEQQNRDQSEKNKNEQKENEQAKEKNQEQNEEKNREQDRGNNDSGLTQVLPFYLAYRAMVRGNIALLAAREQEVPQEERAAQRLLAAAAYDLARSYAGRRPRPALLITVGYSGSGKSALAREVYRRLPAISLSSDRLRKQRAGIVGNASLGTEHYTPEQRDAIYDEMRREAGEWLERDEHVLLDATFLDPAQREATAVLAQERNAEFWILDCRCPDDLIRQRLAKRSSDPNGAQSNSSDADLNVYLQQRNAYNYEATLPFEQEASKAGGYILADMTLPVEEVAHAIVSRLLTEA